MPTTPELKQVTVDYFPRGPKIVRATDDLGNDKKFRTRGNATAALIREVADKLIENLQTGTDITLTLDEDGFIVPTPSFFGRAAATLPAAPGEATMPAAPTEPGAADDHGDVAGGQAAQDVARHAFAATTNALTVAP